MRRSFDSIAWAYDVLAWLVFGSAIKKSQLSFLNYIPNGGQVLILGGGTGWIINMIMEAQPDCTICYIDASSSMIAKSKKKSQIHAHKVKYIVGTVEDIPKGATYDVLVTHFFLDVFALSVIPDVTKKLLHRLKPKGSWLFADFQHTGVWWQKQLIKLMYLFFRRFCGMQGRQLPHWPTVFDNLGLCCLEERVFFQKMITSRLYCNRQRKVC